MQEEIEEKLWLDWSVISDGKILEYLEKAKDPSNEVIEEQVKKIFDKFDVNKDGEIDTGEMGMYLEFLNSVEYFDMALQPAFVQDLMKDLDKDKNKTISPEEMNLFVKAYFKAIFDECEKELSKRTFKKQQ
jgi:Ca2+-binding EF-hand superfamily protein